MLLKFISSKFVAIESVNRFVDGKTRYSNTALAVCHKRPNQFFLPKSISVEDCHQNHNKCTLSKNGVLNLAYRLYRVQYEKCSSYDKNKSATPNQNNQK